jgi:hypothetical protein
MEDIQMVARRLEVSPAGRATVLATVAALTVTAVAPSLAYAGSPQGKGVVAAASGASDFSARRRLAPGSAAAAAAFAGIVGTGIAIAAAQNRRAYYDDYYGYGGPVYVAPAPGPYYYGYDPAYGPNGYGADTPYVNGHPLAGW